jgi:hypothetical protein
VAGLVLGSLEEEGGKLSYAWESICDCRSEFSDRVLVVLDCFCWRVLLGYASDIERLT